jgi:hypothetical protein
MTTRTLGSLSLIIIIIIIIINIIIATIV